MRKKARAVVAIKPHKEGKEEKKLHNVKLTFVMLQSSLVTSMAPAVTQHTSPTNFHRPIAFT